MTANCLMFPGTKYWFIKIDYCHNDGAMQETFIRFAVNLPNSTHENPCTQTTNKNEPSQ